MAREGHQVPAAVMVVLALSSLLLACSSGAQARISMSTPLNATLTVNKLGDAGILTGEFSGDIRAVFLILQSQVNWTNVAINFDLPPNSYINISYDLPLIMSTGKVNISSDVEGITLYGTQYNSTLPLNYSDPFNGGGFCGCCPCEGECYICEGGGEKRKRELDESIPSRQRGLDESIAGLDGSTAELLDDSIDGLDDESIAALLDEEVATPRERMRRGPIYGSGPGAWDYALGPANIVGVKMFDFQCGENYYYGGNFLELYVHNLRFEHATVMGSDIGGAIEYVCYDPEAVLNVTSCVFHDNRAWSASGAAIGAESTGAIEIEDSTFTNNAAFIFPDTVVNFFGGYMEGTGGALILGVDEAIVRISGCVFGDKDEADAGMCASGTSGNVASIQGGSISNFAKTSFYTDSQFYCGNASYAGGAINDGDAGEGEGSEYHSIVGCVFKGNTVGGKGGAAYFRSRPGCTWIIAGSQFIENEANRGGDLSAGDGVGGAFIIENEYDSMTMDDCLFENNVAYKSGQGGAVALKEVRGQTTIRRTDFNGNRAYASEDDGGEGAVEKGGSTGGALFYSPGSGGNNNLNISSCNFGKKSDPSSGNSASSAGALHITGKTKSANIEYCSFYYNEADTQGLIYTGYPGDSNAYFYGGGGAIQVDPQARIWVISSTFYKNKADDGYGGALAVRPNDDNPYQSYVYQSTFAWNRAMKGGAIYSTNEFYLSSSAFYDNVAATRQGHHAVFWNSVVIPDILESFLRVEIDNTLFLSSDPAEALTGVVVNITDTDFGGYYPNEGLPVIFNKGGNVYPGCETAEFYENRTDYDSEFLGIGCSIFDNITLNDPLYTEFVSNNTDPRFYIETDLLDNGGPTRTFMNRENGYLVGNGYNVEFEVDQRRIARNAITDIGPVEGFIHFTVTPLPSATPSPSPSPTPTPSPTLSGTPPPPSSTPTATPTPAPATPTAHPTSTQTGAPATPTEVAHTPTVTTTPKPVPATSTPAPTNAPPTPTEAPTEPTATATIALPITCPPDLSATECIQYLLGESGADPDLILEIVDRIAKILLPQPDGETTELTLTDTIQDEIADFLDETKETLISITPCGENITIVSGGITIQATKIEVDEADLDGDGVLEFVIDGITFSVDASTVDMSYGCIAVSQSTVENFPQECSEECSACPDQISDLQSLTFHDPVTGEALNFTGEVTFNVPITKKAAKQLMEAEEEESSAKTDGDLSCGQEESKQKYDTPECSFFDQDIGCFSTDGCKMIDTSLKGKEPYIVCQCQHTTDFAGIIGSNKAGGADGGNCVSTDDPFDWIFYTSIGLAGFTFLTVCAICLIYHLKRTSDVNAAKARVREMIANSQRGHGSTGGSTGGSAGSGGSGGV
eukprot:TRINITY_DN4256_c0_g1_i1.p1 TRINITY_DN4256_c0_g1~~TRINITY_DN4256_c0_g1_i1.p1  ORF type:complete len:1372 (-),score=243.39 TRINITY_DN4256_c0_g1_i1:106-4221(-)